MASIFKSKTATQSDTPGAVTTPPAPVEATAPVDPTEEKAPAKVKTPKAPKEPKPAKTPPTAEELAKADQDFADLKALAKTKNPVPADLTKEITKARRKARDLRKALGQFIPVSERPKKAKLVTTSEGPEGKPVHKAKKAKDAPAEA